MKGNLISITLLPIVQIQLSTYFHLLLEVLAELAVLFLTHQDAQGLLEFITALLGVFELFLQYFNLPQDSRVVWTVRLRGLVVFWHIFGEHRVEYILEFEHLFFEGEAELTDSLDDIVKFECDLLCEFGLLGLADRG